MHRLVLPHPAFLSYGRWPSPSWIQRINLLGNVAVAPLSNTSYPNKPHASTNQHVSSNSIQNLQLFNNDWENRFNKERDYWQKQLDKEKGDWKKEKDFWQEQLNNWHKQLDNSQKQLDNSQKELSKLHEHRLEDTNKINELERVALSRLDQLLWIKNRFNIRGAIERIASHAVDIGLIKDEGGIQTKLDAIASTQVFQPILKKVVADRGLVQRDVESCIKGIYHELSKIAHGNKDPIIIPEKDFALGEVAALVAFMKLQNGWRKPLRWTVE